MKYKYFILSLIFITSCSSTSKITSAKIKTINYKEFVDSIYNMQEGDKIITIFTQSSCSQCQKMYPYLNKYLDNNSLDGITFYNVSLDTKNGAFVDSYLGVSDGSENDYAKKLDIRLQQWSNRVSNLDLLYMGDTYSYLSTPLFIWYENKIEVKVSNKFEEYVDDYDSFVTFMEFQSENANFNVEFNLTYKQI